MFKVSLLTLLVNIAPGFCSILLGGKENEMTIEKLYCRFCRQPTDHGWVNNAMSQCGKCGRVEVYPPGKTTPETAGQWYPDLLPESPPRKMEQNPRF